MKKLFYSTLFLIVFGISAIAQKNGGMWIPTKLNEKEMKELGLEISVSDIFNTTRPSIKDAIVQFGGGCTGEIISPRGLVLTNHHCGYGEIQAHSSVDNDLLSNGFWAKNNSEELPNPDLSVTFVVEIHNVSEQILAGTSGLSDEEQAKIIEKNIDSLRKNFPHKAYQNIIVKPILFITYMALFHQPLRQMGAAGHFTVWHQRECALTGTGEAFLLKLFRHTQKTLQPTAAQPSQQVL